MPTAEHVMRHAAERPSRLAVCGPKARLTYAELADRVQGAARHLLGRGAGPGTLVAIGLRDPVALLTAALAADLAGATPLVGDPSWSRVRWSRVLTPETADAETPAADVDAPPPAASDVLDVPPPAATRHVLDVPPPATRHVLDVPAPFVAGLVVDVPLPYASGPPVWHEPKPQDLAWACVTSGSTGRPRAIVRSRASWTDSFEHLSELAGIGRDDVVLVPGPLVSSLYAFAAVHALATGATALLPGRRPSTAQAAGATVVHLVPHLLPDLLARAGSLRAAVVGGAALGPGPREQAARAGVRVMSYYGATELSFVAADIDGGGLRPFPGVEIEVRLPGAEKRRAPLGEVWVRSPWLAEGYLGDAAGPLRRDGGGWVSVGDVAEPYRSGGALRVRGRGDGAIQTGGATVVPEDVEEVLRKVPGVADVVVVGSPHPSLGAVVTAVIEAEQAAPPPRALLEAAARDGLDAAQRPRRWHAVPSMPRTPAGKPARALIAARLADGDPLIRRLA